MAVAIRLTRLGKKRSPHFRIVAVDKRKKRDGEYIEKIGLYNPTDNDNPLIINNEKLKKWLSVGAQLSLGMQKLLKNKKIND